MNTQPPRQHEALSDEEREIARVVRALPGGEPPAALDALILKAATDAVASSHPQKNSRWKKGLLGTSALWLGTAAASVLTVGIGWQVFQSMSAPIYELPADENVSSAQVVDREHKDESIAVEMLPQREPAPTSPPPEEAMDAAAATDTFEKPRAVAPDVRARESAVQEANDAQLAKKSEAAIGSLRRDQAAEQDWVPQSSGVVASAAAPSPPPMPVAADAAPAVAAAAPASAARYNESKDKTLDEITVTGSKIRRTESESAQPPRAFPRDTSAESLKERIQADSELAPELWLEEVRNRVKRQDIEGAKASLKLYRDTYPKLRIPEELKPLLK